MLLRDPATFVHQDRFGPADNPPGERGNCNQVCLATLLGLPVDQVPHFFDTDEAIEVQRERMLGWLTERGWVALYLPWTWVGSDWLVPPANGLVMVSGKSPRGPWGHVVVGRLEGADWHLVHDPHPSKTGLDGTPYGIYLVVPLPSLLTSE
jgi:hypothetical protein